jgi:hypothetical protein
MVSGDNPEHTSALAVAWRQNTIMSQPHIVWSPVTGEIIQMIDADHKSRKFPKDHTAGSAVCVLVVGEEDAPFTDGPCLGAGLLMSWLRDLGVPDTWPGGPPHDNAVRGVHLNAPGHYSASQIPGTSHRGPGQINTERLFT